MAVKRNTAIQQIDDYEQKREIFPIMLYNRGGNVSKTCDDLGIMRQTYYNWLESDEDFAEQCNNVTEGLIDLTEDMLIKNIKEGKSTDIQFMLKTKGKSRGYGEKIEIEHAGLIRHAHAHMHYPPEPESIEEWEKQINEADKQRKQLEQGADMALEAPNLAQDAKTLIDMESDANEPNLYVSTA